MHISNGDECKMIDKKRVMISAIITILMARVVSSSPYTFGAKSTTGFLYTSNCKLGPTSLGAFLVSCCWTGKNGKKICQFCVFQYTGNGGEGKYEDCTEIVKQNLDTPPNPPPSTPTGP